MGERKKGLLPGETEEGIYALALENSSRAKALVQAYQKHIPGTPRAKAIAEAEIWEAISLQDKRNVIRLNGYNSTFLASVLHSESPNSFIARGRTLGWEKRGANVEMAWAATLEGKNSWLIKALSYAKQAAEAHEDRIAGRMDEVSITREVNHKFEAALKAYQDDPSIHEEELRKNREAHLARKGKTTAPEKARTPAPTPTRTRRRTKGLDEIIVDGDFQQSKDLWAEAEVLLKDKINPFVKERLANLDSEIGVDELLDNFYLDLRNSYQDLLTRIRRVRNLTGSKQVLEVKREKIRWALEVLRVPVQRGWRKEDLDVNGIKKQYKQLALRFHPDKPTSDENTLIRFNEVRSAYQVLQESGLNL